MRQRLHEDLLVLPIECFDGKGLRPGHESAHLLVVTPVVGEKQEFVVRVEIHQRTAGEGACEQVPEAPKAEDPLDEHLPEDRVGETPLLLHRDPRETLHEPPGEDPGTGPCRDSVPPPYTFTRSIPELGESFLQMYPHRSRPDSSSSRAFAHRSIRSV